MFASLLLDSGEAVSKLHVLQATWPQSAFAMCTSEGPGETLCSWEEGLTSLLTPVNPTPWRRAPLEAGSTAECGPRHHGQHRLGAVATALHANGIGRGLGCRQGAGQSWATSSPVAAGVPAPPVGGQTQDQLPPEVHVSLQGSGP